MPFSHSLLESPRKKKDVIGGAGIVLPRLHVSGLLCFGKHPMAVQCTACSLQLAGHHPVVSLFDDPPVLLNECTTLGEMTGW